MADCMTVAACPEFMAGQEKLSRLSVGSDEYNKLQDRLVSSVCDQELETVCCDR